MQSSNGGGDGGGGFGSGGGSGSGGSGGGGGGGGTRWLTVVSYGRFAFDKEFELELICPPPL